MPAHMLAEEAIGLSLQIDEQAGKRITQLVLEASSTRGSKNPSAYIILSGPSVISSLYYPSLQQRKPQTLHPVYNC